MNSTFKAAGLVTASAGIALMGWYLFEEYMTAEVDPSDF
jgi:hypothetical protein